MNIAIIHHHLNRGGVTSVIRSHIASIDQAISNGESVRIAILFGGRCEAWDHAFQTQLSGVELTLHSVPILDYDQVQQTRATGANVYDALRTTLRSVSFTPSDTVIHVHNHSLGKNVALPEALVAISNDGYPLLLQIHDFAEDLRPDNYARIQHEVPYSDAESADSVAAYLYPQASHIHYAVLNKRDERMLDTAGMDSQRLHWLPNAVPTRDPQLSSSVAPDRTIADKIGLAASQDLVLYPSRCIRRKNVGEALLYAAASPQAAVVGMTLPPLNPLELDTYNAWKELSRALSLPCLFELGGPKGLTLQENLAAASAICTTSVAEGFGMVFLESWLACRPLTGRDLPEITCDFRELGIQFPYLHDRCRIPTSLLDTERLQRTIVSVYVDMLATYNRPPSVLADLLDKQFMDDSVDFADLPVEIQKDVVVSVSENPPLSGHRTRRQPMALQFTRSQIH